jgi:competence protein ComGC
MRKGFTMVDLLFVILALMLILCLVLPHIAKTKDVEKHLGYIDRTEMLEPVKVKKRKPILYDKRREFPFEKRYIC